MLLVITLGNSCPKAVLVCHGLNVYELKVGGGVVTMTRAGLRWCSLYLSLSAVFSEEMKWRMQNERC